MLGYLNEAFSKMVDTYSMLEDVNQQTGFTDKMVKWNASIGNFANAVKINMAKAKVPLGKYQEQTDQMFAMDSSFGLLVQEHSKFAVGVLKKSMKTFAGVLKSVLIQEAKMFMQMEYAVSLGLMRAKLEGADILIKSLRQFAYQQNERIKWAWRMAQLCICQMITGTIYYPNFDETFNASKVIGDQNGKNQHFITSEYYSVAMWAKQACKDLTHNIETELINRYLHTVDFNALINGDMGPDRYGHLERAVADVVGFPGLVGHGNKLDE